MSWAVTAVVAISAVSTAVEQDKAGKAREKARKQAEKDQEQARAAEVFAETEGAGVGQQGKIDLAAESLSEADLRIRRGSTLRV